MGRIKAGRSEFTRDHDNFLAKYLAKYCPTQDGRRGRRVYDRLADNAQNKWPWSVHHTSQSWRERYVKNSIRLDAMILRYQRKHNKTSVDKRKRAAEPMQSETSAKRVKHEEEESSSTRHVHVSGGDDDVGLTIPFSETDESTERESESASKLASTSKSKHPPATPPRAPHPAQEPEPTNARPTTASPSSPCSSANSSTRTARKPTSDHSFLQARHDTPEAFLPPDQQLPLTNGTPEAFSTPRVKRSKVRPGTPSDMFASEPPSPKMDGDIVVPQDPPAQTQPAPPAPSQGVNGAYTAPPVHPCAPPRFVNSFHGQVLVDREGHVPRALLRGEKDDAEEESDKTRWPPARGGTVKQRRTSRPDAEVDAHHPFSQPQPRPERPHSPSAHAPQMLDESRLHRRTAAALFAGQVRRAAPPQVESNQHENNIRNGVSTDVPVVAAVPQADLFSGHSPKQPSKVFRLPAPRAPTRSPLRPQETRRPEPRLKQPSPTKRARRPELARTRRQSIGHGYGNKNDRERERRREVPSIDLVALSHSSMSARSHSRSSTDTSAPTRRSRWSLPAFVHATPWVLDEQASSSLAYGDLGPAHTSSTPRLMYTPSPVRSIVGTSAPAPLANGISGSPSTSLVPHPPDLQLVTLHGLSSLLAHMSANHGLALSVVEAVYKRVRSLREADEVLKGMREAAEGYGEREIERRLREWWGGVAHRRKQRGQGLRGDDGKGTSRLRYVMASEDGAGSEYMPPETSRAAMWMRQSESASYVEEIEDDEEAEGREVEEELRDRSEDEDEDDGKEVWHDISRHVPMADGSNEAAGQDEDDSAQNTEGPERVTNLNALLEDTRLAKELERKLGKQRFRMNVAMLFTKSLQT